MMRILSVKIIRQWAFTLLVGLWAVAGCSSGGGGSPSVSFSPSESTLAVGDTVEVTVEVKHVKDAYYAAFDLTYDPAVLEFVSGEEGLFFSRSGAEDTVFAVAKTVGPPGRLSVGVTRLDGADGVSGGGSLMTLTFQGLSQGSSPLTFSQPHGFRDSADEEVPIKTWTAGVLNVNQAVAE